MITLRAPPLENSQAFVMNIVVVNDFAHINGGASQIALSSALGLAQRGHRVTVFSAVPPVMEDLRHEGVSVVVTHQHEIAKDPSRLRAAVQGIWNTRARRMMREVLINAQVSNTIVHLHGWTKALSSSVVPECENRHFKVICTLHDYFVACPNGGFYNFRSNEICHLRPMSLSCMLEHCDSRSFAQKQWRVIRQIAQTRWGHIPDCIQGFIAVSDFSKGIVEPYLPPKARIFRVDNPIDVPRYTPAPIGVQSPFVFVGRLSPEKGVRLLVQAGRRLDADLLFVGDGSCRADIEAAMPNARITGWVPRQEVYAYLRSARALVVPSLWYETQGLVVAEAAALGIPSIVPDTAAAREMVTHGMTGLWFNGGDERSLCEALAALADTEKARTMGMAAYESYWREPASLTRHVEKLEDCYRQLLAS